MAVGSVSNYYGGISKITSNGVEVATKNWSLTYSGNTRNATNSKQGRYRVPGGVIDMTGTIRVVLDFDNPQTKLTVENEDPTPDVPHPGLRPGNIVSLELFLGDSTDYDPIGLDAIIDELTAETDPESTDPQEFTINWSLHDQGTVELPDWF